MQRLVLLATLVILAGCQSVAGTPKARLAADAGALARLAENLPGDYDNHEQVARARAQDKDGKGIVPIRVRQSVRVVGHGRDGLDWLWRLQSEGKPNASVWLLRAQAQAGGSGVRIVPFRPIDATAASAAFADATKTFHYDAAQWAPLEPCALNGGDEKGAFHASANVEACSALLPGLGEDAALLPLRLTLAGDMLETATFADLARGPAADEQARRVRWFSGWAAINGGGPQASAQNQDWHVQRDLRLSSEGGRVALRWRDGAASGYSLELERTTYAERNLAVLQLNVIEDGSGKTLTYAWSDPQADAIGINIGWLQVGLVHDRAALKPQ